MSPLARTLLLEPDSLTIFTRGSFRQISREPVPSTVSPRYRSTLDTSFLISVGYTLTSLYPSVTL
jgi:hypothetical protein